MYYFAEISQHFDTENRKDCSLSSTETTVFGTLEVSGAGARIRAERARRCGGAASAVAAGPPRSAGAAVCAERPAAELPPPGESHMYMYM